MDGFSLKGRIAERRQTELRPLVERRGGEERRVPTWMKRLEAKDLTGQIKERAA